MNPISLISKLNTYPVLKRILCLLIFLSFLAGSALLAAERDLRRLQRGEFLTEPSSRDAFQVCRDYLMHNRLAKGFEARDLDEVEVRSRVFSKHNGITHLYLRQRFVGIDVEDGTYYAAVDRQGRMLLERDRFKRRLQKRTARLLRSHITAPRALRFAALAIGESAAVEMTTVAVPAGPMKETIFSAPALSRDDIPVKLNFLEMENGDLRIAWRIVIRTTDGQDWWDLFIDASSGALLKQVNWVAKETYEVYPVPLESPSNGARSIIDAAADATASPFGWHDMNGVAGAELQDTRGNNVFAQEDADDDDAGGLRPDGGANLIFTPSINPQLQPSANHEAATVNLFYWNNILHDVLYQYGFDEAAGNFQQNNYGKGGVGGDGVRADSQDGSGVNNATFATPPDGTPSRMQMYLWVPDASSNLEITTPQSVAGNYEVGDAAFGAWTNGLNGTLVLALDGANAAGPSITDGCSGFTNAAAVSGNIALVDRGDCLFVEKTANAQAAGADGLIVVNNDGDGVLGMAGQDPTLSIPVLLIGQSDGNALKAELNNGVTADMTVVQRRDSAFDNGIIAHEYAHGLTMRLTGGAGNSSCLNQTQSSGMGEGWSDWFGLTMTATSSDSPIVPRAIGTYAGSEPINGPGIRNYPYTRDMGVNALTFSDIASLNRPHGVGEVWASALWDLYWNLVDAYGFDADLYRGTGGNNLLIQLVVDGLKFQDCNPTFLGARDAILTADLVSNSGANQCLIWEAFARRGMGESAVSTSAGSVAVTEAFDVPTSCAVQCGNGVLDAGEQCDDGNNLTFDGCASNCRNENVLQALTGQAQGGQLNLILNGIGIDITTTPGESADAVAAALVAAVNGNTALQSIASIAANDQGQIVVTGEVDQFVVQDTGLVAAPGVTQVPLAWPWRLLLLLIGLGLFMRRFPRGQHS